jgi:TM2 domain-containing membrane protein YozV
MYCSNCGAQIDDNAVICVKCGAPTSKFKTANLPDNQPTEGFDWLTTLLLCFFLGAFGAHNFYTKKTTVAIIQLLTLGGCGIWALVDFIMILVGTYVDGNGKPLVKK